jgi:two-component system sensor histidine kinase UhpB
MEPSGPPARPGPSPQVWIPAVYALLSGIWIALSDPALALLARDPGDLERWSILKGWGFVAVTALLLHLGLRRVLAARLADAERLALVERRARALVAGSPDAILILSGLTIAFANQAAARLVGAAGPDELLGRPVLDLLDPSEHASVRARSARLQGGAVDPFTQRRLMRRLDGTTFRAEAAMARLEHDEQRSLQISFRDVTQAWTLQEEVRRVNRALRTLGSVNEALVRAGSEVELMEEVCRVAVEEGGYRLAWVGFAEQDEARSIRAVAVHGGDPALLQGLELRPGHGAWPPGLAAEAIRSGRVVVADDLEAEGRSEAGRALDRSLDLRSAIALPFSGGAGRGGVLVLGAAEPDHFEPAVVQLLGQLVDDLAFGLVALATRAALAEERAFLGAILENAGVLVVVVDGQGRLVRANPEFERLSGWTVDGLKGRPAWDQVLPPDEARQVRDGFARIQEGPFPAVHVLTLVTRAGERRTVEWTLTSLRATHGQAAYLLGIGQDVTEQRRAEERVRESREQLRALAGRLQTVREEEKTRMARDLHDELGQLLTGLKMDLRWLENRLGDLPQDDRVSALLDRAVAASELADQTVASVQRIAAELRPGALDRLGLAPALRQEARRFQERTGIGCQARVDEATPEPPPEVATALYRICQEALTNVSRHAGARQVEVALDAEPQALVLRVSDDGRGLDAVSLGPEALGLLGMTERATLLGGEVSFTRRPEGGTVVTARLPVTGARGAASS